MVVSSAATTFCLASECFLGCNLPVGHLMLSENGILVHGALTFAFSFCLTLSCATVLNDDMQPAQQQGVDLAATVYLPSPYTTAFRHRTHAQLGIHWLQLTASTRNELNRPLKGYRCMNQLLAPCRYYDQDSWQQHVFNESIHPGSYGGGTLLMHRLEWQPRWG